MIKKERYHFCEWMLDRSGDKIYLVLVCFAGLHDDSFCDKDIVVFVI